MLPLYANEHAVFNNDNNEHIRIYTYNKRFNYMLFRVL